MNSDWPLSPRPRRVPIDWSLELPMAARVWQLLNKEDLLMSWGLEYPSAEKALLERLRLRVLLAC